MRLANFGYVIAWKIITFLMRRKYLEVVEYIRVIQGGKSTDFLGALILGCGLIMP